uniref:BTB domain-containing protein n=1 Tax=Parastrongyloides trichosuri TaxID=131310 RepID=A0A0N4ZV35_PARTI
MFTNTSNSNIFPSSLLILEGEKLSERDYFLYKVIERIEKKGHCLNSDEFKNTIVYITSDLLPREFLKIARNQFTNYLHAYNLTERTAFKDKNLEGKDNFIQLTFPDGNIVVDKTFLSEHFLFFKGKLNFDGEVIRNKIEFDNFSHKHFKMILKFYYGEPIFLSLKHSIEIYRVCDFFTVDDLFMVHIKNYLNYFYMQLSKTKFFYENQIFFTDDYLGGENHNFFVNSVNDYNDIQRLIQIYNWKKSYGRIKLEKEVPLERMNKNVADLPISYAMFEFDHFKSRKLCLKAIGNQINESEFTPLDMSSRVVDAIINGREVFVLMEDDINYSICYLNLINNEKKFFEQYYFYVQFHTHRALIPYKDRFILLRNSAVRYRTGFIEEDNTITLHIFKSPKRIYTKDMSIKKLFNSIEDDFSESIEKKLDIDVGERILNEYFIFEFEDYIYFLLKFSAYERESVFFRFHLEIGKKEDLPPPGVALNVCSFAYYKNRLYFLTRSIKNRYCNTYMEHYTSTVYFKDTTATIKGYYYDLNNRLWGNYKQPHVEGDAFDVQLTIMNNELHFFKMKKTCLDLLNHELVLRYNPDDEDNWIVIKNSSCPLELGDCTKHFASKLIRTPLF